jgi:hypothetical protein
MLRETRCRYPTRNEENDKCMLRAYFRADNLFPKREAGYDQLAVEMTGVVPPAMGPLRDLSPGPSTSLIACSPTSCDVPRRFGWAKTTATRMITQMGYSARPTSWGQHAAALEATAGCVVDLTGLALGTCGEAEHLAQAA